MVTFDRDAFHFYPLFVWFITKGSVKNKLLKYSDYVGFERCTGSMCQRTGERNFFFTLTDFIIKAETPLCDKSRPRGCCNKSSSVNMKIFVAATEFCHCDLSHEFKLVYISQRQNKRKQPCRSNSADEATCRRDVSHSVSRP